MITFERVTRCISYFLLGMTALIMGISAFLLYTSFNTPSYAVTFRSPVTKASASNQNNSQKPELPSQSRTVQILKNHNFGLSPKERDKTTTSERSKPCLASEYVKRVLHLHPEQGVHIQFQDGETAYLLLSKFYQIPLGKKNAGDKTGYSEIAFTGVASDEINFTFRKKSGETDGQICSDRMRIADRSDTVTASNGEEN